jgi:uncharacterized membrane protein YccC
MLPMIAGVVIGQPVAGAAASFGALTVGIAIITAGPRVPIGTLIAATIGIGAATFIGSVAGLVPPVHLVLLAACGFLAGLMVAAGRGAAQVGINATVALLIFGRHAAGPELAALHASWVLAGGLAQTVVATVLRSPRPLQAQREALAAGYEALAGTATEPPAHAVAEAALTARDAVSRWKVDDNRPGAESLRGLADQLDRIRQELHALHFERAQLSPDREEYHVIDEALALTGQALADIPPALRRHRAPETIEPTAAKLISLASQLGTLDGQGTPAGPAATFASARIEALAGQLRATGRMAARLAGTRRISLPVAASYTAEAVVVMPGQLSWAARQIRAAMSPSSPAFRHAVRLAVLIPAATELSRLLPWPRAYWLPLTTVIVLKPDFAATARAGTARAIGTAIGIIAPTVIIITWHPRGAVMIALIAAIAWLSYTVFAASYAIYSVFLTALVIFLVDAAEKSTIITVENRVVDTLIGGAIAILAYLVWPTWEAKTLQAATAGRFEAIGRFLRAVLQVYREPEAFDRAALADFAAETRRAQSEVMGSLERARGEPARIRPDIERYSSVLAAARRIVAGTHALASHLADAKAQVAVPRAALIADQLDDAMSELVSSIQAGRPPGELPELRQSQLRLAAESAECLSPEDRRGAILAALLDPLVDSIDTAADLLGNLYHRAA